MDRRPTVAAVAALAAATATALASDSPFPKRTTPDVPTTRPETAAAGLTGDDPTFKGKAVKPEGLPKNRSEGALGGPAVR